MNYKQISENIESAVAYFDELDKISPRIKLANDRYKKSKWRKRFVSELMRRKKNEANQKFVMICSKFDVPFKKMNQIIFGNYSDKIRYRGEN